MFESQDSRVQSRTAEGRLAASSATVDDVANENDNLFTDSNPSGAPNAEAAMAWQSAGDTDAELVE